MPHQYSTIIDWMALVQRIPAHPVNISKVAAVVLGMTLKEGEDSERIDVVFNTYK